MRNNEFFKNYSINKIAIAILLFGFTITGLVDLLMQSKPTYSVVMGMDKNRVYFYTFFLLITGCWLLYNKWFVGIGFITLATFSTYFAEYLIIHNYFASIAIYIGIIIDIVKRKQLKWLIPLVIIGSIQGIAFHTGSVGYFIVGIMEFLSLCIGSVFIIKSIR